MTFKGCICSWHICTFKLLFVIFLPICAVMLDLYEDCGRHAGGHTWVVWEEYSGTYGNNVKHMSTYSPGHTVDCSEFI